MVLYNWRILYRNFNRLWTITWTIFFFNIIERICVTYLSRICLSWNYKRVCCMWSLVCFKRVLNNIFFYFLIYMIRIFRNKLLIACWLSCRSFMIWVFHSTIWFFVVVDFRSALIEWIVIFLTFISIFVRLLLYCCDTCAVFWYLWRWFIWCLNR